MRVLTCPVNENHWRSTMKGHLAKLGLFENGR